MAVPPSDEHVETGETVGAIGSECALWFSIPRTYSRRCEGECRDGDKRKPEPAFERRRPQKAHGTAIPIKRAFLPRPMLDSE